MKTIYKSLILLLLLTFANSQHVDIVGDSITKNGYPNKANQLMKDIVTNGEYITMVYLVPV